MVEGQKREGIKVSNLAYVLKVIRGFRDSEIELDCQPMEGKQGLASQIIFDKDQNLQLRVGGQAKLANKFRALYINKLQSESKSTMPRAGKPVEITYEKELTLRPALSQKTLEYAEKRRIKLNTENCDVVEHLLRKQTVMENKKRD